MNNPGTVLVDYFKSEASETVFLLEVDRLLF